MTTITLTDEETAYILEALRYRLMDACDRQFAAEHIGDDRTATDAAVDASNIRAVRKRIAAERQAQSGLAGRSLVGPAR